MILTEKDEWAEKLMIDDITIDYGTPDDILDLDMNRASSVPRSLWDKAMAKWFRWRHADELNGRIEGPVYGYHRGDNIGQYTGTGEWYT